MLLDKFKSAGVALIAGMLALAMFAWVSLQLVAKQYSVTPSSAAHYVIAQPAKYWPLEIALYGALSFLLAAAAAGGIFALLKNVRWTWRAKDLRSEESAAALLTMSTPKGKPRIFAGRFSGKPFYASLEDRAVVIGPPGTGKTAFLLNQLLKCADDQMSFCCIDFKPEIHSIIGAALAARGYQVMLIDPVSGTSPDHWNPLAEIADNDEIAITELAACLLPVINERDKPFVEAQRDWLLGALLHLKHQDPAVALPAIYQFLTQPAKTITDVLSRSPCAPAQAIGNQLATGMAGGDKLVLQGYTGATRALKFLGYDAVKAAMSHSDFDMRELGKTGRPVALFLKFAESKAEAMGPILTLMAARIFSTLIDTAGSRAPVALFFDELGVLTPIPNLAKRLNTIRSRHMPTWMYFQAVSQLEDGYGHGAAARFFTAASIKMCFRLDDNETREEFAKLVGKTRDKKETSSQTYGASISNKSTTYEWRDVIQPHQLGELKPGDALLLCRGASAIGRATPHYRDFPEFKR